MVDGGKYGHSDLSMAGHPSMQQPVIYCVHLSIMFNISLCNFQEAFSVKPQNCSFFLSVFCHCIGHCNSEVTV